MEKYEVIEETTGKPSFYKRFKTRYPKAAPIVKEGTKVVVGTVVGVGTAGVVIACGAPVVAGLAAGGCTFPIGTKTADLIVNSNSRRKIKKRIEEGHELRKEELLQSKEEVEVTRRQVAVEERQVAVEERKVAVEERRILLEEEKLALEKQKESRNWCNKAATPSPYSLVLDEALIDLSSETQNTQSQNYSNNPFINLSDTQNTQSQNLTNNPFMSF